MNLKILLIVISVWVISSEHKEFIENKNYELKEEIEDSLRDILDEYENN